MNFLAWESAVYEVDVIIRIAKSESLHFLSSSPSNLLSSLLSIPIPSPPSMRRNPRPHTIRHQIRAMAPKWILRRRRCKKRACRRLRGENRGIFFCFGLRYDAVWEWCTAGGGSGGGGAWAGADG